MRFAVVLGLATSLGIGCDNGKQHFHPEAGAGPDADMGPAWWHPRRDTTKNWDIQINAPIDTTAPHVMYTLDLWDLVPSATTIEYGDGDPVAVPAGSLSGKIVELHARNGDDGDGDPSDDKPTIVICRFSTGAIDLDEPDARKFPGYEANPPDRPTVPASGSVIGWSTFNSDGSTNANQRYLDISATNRGMWSALMFKRLDLAKQIGCDGVAPTYNDVPPTDPSTPTARSDSGFVIPIMEMTSWFVEVAAQAHTRELSAGMVGGYAIPGQTDALNDDFDWLMIERCGEYQDCDNARPFLNRLKPVFAIDYDTDSGGVAQSANLVCNTQVDSMLNEGLVKDVALSSAVRTACVP